MHRCILFHERPGHKVACRDTQLFFPVERERQFEPWFAFQCGGSAASSVGVRSFAKSGLSPGTGISRWYGETDPPAGSDTSSRAGACASAELLITNRGMPSRVWPSYAALMVIRATWPALGYGPWFAQGTGNGAPGFWNRVPGAHSHF